MSMRIESLLSRLSVFICARARVCVCVVNASHREKGRKEKPLTLKVLPVVNPD